MIFIIVFNFIFINLIKKKILIYLVRNYFFNQSLVKKLSQKVALI